MTRDYGMDLSIAITEPLVNLVSFHNRFNQLVKITGAALHRLLDDTKGAGGQDIVSKYIRVSDQFWGTTKFANPERIVTKSINQNSNLWIVEVFSAFDIFMDGVRAELDRWHAVSGMPKIKGELKDEDGNISLTSLYKQTSWDDSAVSKYSKVFDFFRVCRNCIAHRSGLASKLLAKINKDIGELKEFDEWPVSVRKVSRKKAANKPAPLRQRRGISLPTIKVNQPVGSEPQHAVFASTLAYRIAEDINRHLVKTLGAQGLAYMAAHHSVLADEQPTPVTSYTPEAAVTYFLANRYRVKNVTGEKTIAALKSLGVWKKVRDKFGAEVRRTQINKKK